MKHDREVAAIVLFLVCAGAFAYAGWSRPAVPAFSLTDASVYRESYRACERKWRLRQPGPEPHPTALAAEWAERYAREQRPAARAGCMHAIRGRPPQA